MSETLMIVAGETSGELYGALLADSLKKRLPGIRIIGIGGERMKASGVELISWISSAFGLTEAVSSLRTIKETFKKASEALGVHKPRVLVLIDYPDFNLKLAAEAKKNNIKVLYYVSPQVWAWRRRRVNKIAKLVDRMAVLLPFEEKIYRDAGLDCEFVGHPVLDEIRELKKDKSALKRFLGLDENMPLLSLLPGSRPHELNSLLPVVLDAVREFKKKFRDFQFCVPFAPNTDINKYSDIIDRLKEEGVVINKGGSLKALAASDLAVIASGTASLQAVLLGVPVVVIYKLFPLTYMIGKLIVKVRHISLVNILTGQEVVKELLQSDVTAQNIINESWRIMNDKFYKDRMMEAYGKVHEMFSGRRASERVAEMVEEMAAW
ncbi:MAG: lipid-A-disaccharide synthase [Nitrospirota bacterium]